MHIFSRFHHLIGSALLISGMSIGVGMLALPVVTSPAGFFPSVCVYLTCWLFMVLLGRLLLEACTWFPPGANLITLCRRLLGKPGSIACWILYLFLFYCLMTAHIAAGGQAMNQIFSNTLPPPIASFFYCALFVPVVYLGTRSVDRVNISLMIGIAITYLVFLFASVKGLDFSLLARSDWGAIWPAFPVILTAFGYQNLIPTLYTYLEGDHKTLRKAIWLGSSLPLLIYILWNFLVLGIVPQENLAQALDLGQSAIIPLQNALQHSFFSKIAQVFAFFAMTTSFIGIGLALTDFWADGLRWEKRGSRKIILLGLVFFLPFLLVLIDPTIFITALEAAGGIGMILLLGVIPILLVWSGRYIHRHPNRLQCLKGGKKNSWLFLFVVWQFSPVSYSKKICEYLSLLRN